MRHVDLLLLHAPSVYDFRQHAILYGPVSDLIPSSTVFEMYPLGFLTMASYLRQRKMQVRIVNLALRMINDKNFDVPQFLRKIGKPGAIGIDLHWMPHCHGALEVARICKEIYPDVPVIMGGLSSSYFHEELIEYLQVDFVLRGDSTEPPLHKLLQALQSGGDLHKIPNLTWKSNGKPVFNAMGFIPPALDYADIRPDLMVEMVLRYRDFQSVVPFNGWAKNPITTVFTVKGCSYQCVTCGSSQTACTHLTHRKQPAYRLPESLVANMKTISRLTRGPIFLVGDLLQAGMHHAMETLQHLKAANIRNEIVFEFFTVPPLEFIHAIAAHVKHWSIEFSPESHAHEVRNAQEGETDYDNAAMERFFQEVLSLNCTRLDVFFMIGLPAQTTASVMETIDYCEHLFQLGDKRLSCFISPMGPFIDPASRGFEEPERFGYTLFARTLAEHRRLLVEPTWERILNYETRWMTRKELVDVTYAAAAKLNALKVAYNRISKARGARVDQRIAEGLRLREQLDKEIAAGTRPASSAALTGEISRYSMDTVCDKSELFWQRHLLNFRVTEILKILGRYLWKGMTQRA